MTPRTPAERERMYRYLDEHWPWDWTGRDLYRKLLATFPKLWDHLPPDPAETARREAETDRRIVESYRNADWDSAKTPTAVIDRMAARAKAGHMVLADREGE